MGFPEDYVLDVVRPTLKPKEDPSILLATLAVAFAAFCVWLTVRIVNRRERWAKWTLAVTIGLPILYPLSVGPAAYVQGSCEASWTGLSPEAERFYGPLIRGNGPEWSHRMFHSYVKLWIEVPIGCN